MLIFNYKVSIYWILKGLKKMKVVVIGGGSAGIMSAISAKNSGMM